MGSCLLLLYCAAVSCLARPPAGSCSQPAGHGHIWQCDGGGVVDVEHALPCPALPGLWCACSVETKEVRLRPVTEAHDYEVKVKSAKAFLAKGSKVKLTMQFNGREMRFKDQGKEMMLVRGTAGFGLRQLSWGW